MYFKLQSALKCRLRVQETCLRLWSETVNLFYSELSCLFSKLEFWGGDLCLEGFMPQDCLGGSVCSHVRGVPQAHWFAFAALHFCSLIAPAKDLVAELSMW